MSEGLDLNPKPRVLARWFRFIRSPDTKTSGLKPTAEGNLLYRFIQLALLPFGIYLAAYIALTYPLILSFNSLYFCDDGDGYQTIWNLWSVQQAVLHGRGSIFFTPLLHWPVGAPLWLHSLSPLNGLLSVPLCLILSPQTVYNALIVFAFVSAGLTAFWLAWDQTRSWWPSLAAGYIFTFAQIHFAHASGHMHQTATQVLPLYVLLMIRCVRRRTLMRGLCAGVAALGVLLCDHYQFVYAGLITATWLGVHALQSLRFTGPLKWACLNGVARSTALLGLMVAIICGPLLYFMARAAREPVDGIHKPEMFSADLLNEFVPGWMWHYHDLTRPVWETIGQYHEKSVAIGVAALIAALFARHAMAWWCIAICFAACALGPTLKIYDHPIAHWMPYRLLELLPLFSMSGCPARMMMGAQLAVAVLAAMGLSRFGTLSQIRASRWRTLAVVAFMLALIVESQPHVQATVPIDVPRWVIAIRDLPIDGAVMELRTDDTSRQLYYQTVHGRPMAFGYLARVPSRVLAVDDRMRQLHAEGRYAELRRQGFGAIVTGVSAPLLGLNKVYEDREVRIYLLPRD